MTFFNDNVNDSSSFQSEALVTLISPSKPIILFITLDSKPFNIDIDIIIAILPTVNPIIDIHPVKRLGPEPLPPNINLFAILSGKFIRTSKP